MSKPKGIKYLAIAVMVFGAYNLLGVGSYKNFAIMFKPLPAFIIISIYAFTVLYGICGVYCGSRMLRFENWARQIVVGMTALSIVLSFVLNGTVMRNFKELIASGEVEIPPDMTGSIYVYAAVIMAIVTLFELAIVFYFTRPKIVEAFK